jgi:hypothetical protein
VNPFSKKRKLEEISNSATTEKKPKPSEQEEFPIEVNETLYFDAPGDISSNGDFKSALDDSKMVVD